MNKYLAKGKCQKCGANEVIAHSGYKHLCQRCDQRLWNNISTAQKDSYMSSGRVHLNKRQNNAK